MTAFKAYSLAKDWARDTSRALLFVTSTEEAAIKFSRDLQFFSAGRAKGEVCLFPAPDTPPYTHLTPEPDIWMDRIRVLYRLLSGEPVSVVAPVSAVLRRTLPPETFKKYCRLVRAREIIDLKELTLFLTEAGYINMPLVEDEGAFSVRGGIIDIFSPSLERPVRLELDGDEIASIRTFDPSTQRSSFSLSQFTIIPVRNAVLNDETKSRALGKLKHLCDENGIKATERREFAEAVANGFYTQSVETCLPLFYEKLATIHDYLPKGSLFSCDDEIEINETAEKLFRKLSEARDEAEHIEKIIGPEELYDTKVGGQKTDIRCQMSDIGSPSSDFGLPTSDLRLPASDLISSASGDLKSIINTIKNWQRSGLRTVITCHTGTQAERVLDIIRWHGLHAEMTERPFHEIESLHRSTIWITLGKLSAGFVSKKDSLAILRDEDIFGSKIARQAYEARTLDTFTDLSQLNEGDNVIHKDHGIGRYLGLKNLEINRTRNDFLELQYLGGDKLYLPVWKINLVSRYIGAGAADGTVALDKLGGTRWTKTQARVTAEIRTIAMELLRIYAERKAGGGFAFGSRDELLEEFEAAFPYDETPDQWRAIEETLADMQKDISADRLICGDVGYGKTEVAMRAAFKAVADKKQVIVLVPTTVLAFQHYENFLARFKAWPVKIEMLSRFRSRTEQKKIIADLSRGTVDIVIGTHRLLQKDINIHDLGLLIIDEEHRFGVAHKERIKKLKVNVDTITMTATPIPRTLNMSLSGLRDISIINTPPANRLKIRTYVAGFDEDLIRAACMAELSRGGQVFFVHNRVESIEKMHELLVRLLPGARIVTGHGQMDEHELEEVMIKFLEKKADILLCTTIIESGIDVPSANTIMINRADTMGLAQLYQLRGRVGRSNLQAYAYLLTPKAGREDADARISPTAQKRLSLLQRYTELGSGFQIAMHDLEIRGAGNLLGAQQSGHINAIGYELYNELLEKTIRRLQGKPESVKLDVEITLPVPAFIPTDYVSDQGQRLVLYKRLAEASDTALLDDIAKEMEDRFGRAPELVKNLLRIVEIRITAKEMLIESIHFDKGMFAIKFHPKTTVKPEAVLKLVKGAPARYAFRQPSTLLVKDPAKTPVEIFAVVREILNLLA